MNNQSQTLISAKKLALGMFLDAKYYQAHGFPNEYLGYTDERKKAVKKAKTAQEVYSIMEEARKAS